MADLTQKEWTAQLANSNNAIVLDVRTEEEVADGFIPNAINLDIRQGQEFIDQLEALDKDKTYFVYCRSGARSGQACAIMNELGFSQAFNLLGGFLEWEGEIISN